jgi:hypothetical protein
MKIIMLHGEQNRGKTAVLHLFHEILIAAGGKPSCVERIGAKNQRDFSDTVNYKNKKIAVFTMGDLEKPLRDAIQHYSAAGCDVLVCACNDSYTNLLGQASIPLEKTLASDLFSRNEANRYDAFRIVRELEKALFNTPV